MDSKYSVISANRGENGFNNLKRNKPSPIVFNNESSKKMKFNNQNDMTLKGASVANGNRNTKNGETNIQTLAEQKRALPIYCVRNRLLDEIKRRNTLIVIGETGSGKTTQIPQYIHSARLQGDGRIGITQPRRVAAITIATRVAKEMNTQLGELVGYTVRFEDVTSHCTKIKYLTDGMLLREAMADKLLKAYNVIVLDEAHERTVHTDVLFGIVKQAQQIRKEKELTPLKIIIMSATMEVDHFSKYFNNCQTVYLEGRTYPVKIFHSINRQDDYLYSCLVTLFQIHMEAPPSHDILMFLTGQEEIEAMASNIRLIAKDPEMNGAQLKVFPLYSALSASQQLEAFKPVQPGIRKIIIGTNVAETSITITGIKYIIDSGMVKIRTHHPGTGLDVLKVQKISQAQAWQRTGRAGRESPGICYRMYTKNEFESFSKMTKPEIQRCSLSSVVLQLLSLGINILKFDFMDKPPEESIKTALEQLHHLGAITNVQDIELTKLGKEMAQFPLDPKYSKILLSAKDYNCLEEALTIVSVLSSESIFITPAMKKDEAVAARKKYMSQLGDHISLLNVYRAFHSIPNKRAWCHENFLNIRNLLYARDIRTQLANLCERFKIPFSTCGSDMDQIRKCLLTGLYMNVAELQHNKKYVTLESRQQVAIHPSSGLHGSCPQCVVFTEIVQTGKSYLRSVTSINPDWLKEIAPEYLRTHRLFYRTDIQNGR